MKLYWLVTSVLVVLASVGLSGAAAATAPQEREASESSDIWGGKDVSMEITPQGATLEFDCAHGNMLEPIKANAKGEFAARGTFTPEHGGPISRDNPPRDLPATYKGSIDGDTMRLEVVLTDKDQAPEPFTLTRGRAGRVRKCR